MRTERIFDLDAYVTENEATVLSCRKSEDKEFEGLYEVITDSTVFAPEGGGQGSDKGFFDSIAVVDVREKDGELVHYLEAPVPNGSKTMQRIDFELRRRRMQNHNAEHLLCGIIHKKFGYENVGFHITENKTEDGRIIRETTMDVDGPLTAEEIKSVEKEANYAIAKNVKVYAMLPSKEEAKDIEYRSKLEITEGLRLVIIEGYDICACCVPCLKSSAEMMCVKVLDFMPHRGGTRLSIVAGLDAYEDYAMLHESNGEIMKLTSSKRDKCADGVKLQKEKAEETHEEIIALKKEITELYKESLSEILKDSSKKYNVFFADGLDEVQSRNIVNDAVEKNRIVLCVMFAKNSEGYRFVAGKNDELTDDSLKNFATVMREKINARGGGSEKMIQGSVSNDKEVIQTFFDDLN